MKLRNRKTGEIANWCIDKDILRTCDGTIVCNSLAELNIDWEDVSEEPKGFGWRIDENNEPEEIGFGFSLEEIDRLKEIGLWFSTKEETELAVRKLKAWKRLKDGGFVFCGKGDCLDTMKFDYGPAGYNNQDFNLLFGGEE